MNQGDIWLHEPGIGKARPVLIVTRNSVIPLLTAVVAAPVTSTVRAAPAEIRLDESDGVDHESVANLDAVTVVAKKFLTRRIGTLGVRTENAICTALNAMADC